MLSFFGKFFKSLIKSNDPDLELRIRSRTHNIASNIPILTFNGGLYYHGQTLLLIDLFVQ
jgi:hypothetical protein